MTKKLIELGLTEKEAEVYLTLLKSGDATADQLATSSKLNRSTTYVQIKKLSEYGLVSTFKRGKKTFYAAESPNNLIRILEQKKQNIINQEIEVAILVSELLKLFGSSVDRPVVRVFEGKEGLESMRNAILEEKPAEILMMVTYNRMQRVFTEEELRLFTKKRQDLGIESSVMYSMPEGEDFKPFPLQKLKRVDPKKIPFGSDIYIYNDTVSFASTESQIVGVTIRNRDIAATLRGMFLGLWTSR
jgi:sugar-specific transcriptional regulator TrmB